MLTEDGWRQFVLEPTTRSTRVWWWVLGLVVVLVPLAYVALYGVALQQQPAYYGFAEDFSVGAGRFPLFDRPERSAEVQGGRYLLTNKTPGASDAVVGTAWSSDVGVIEIKATVSPRDGEDSGFGLVLYHESGSEGYMVSVWPGGHIEVAAIEGAASAWSIQATGSSIPEFTSGDVLMRVELNEDSTIVSGYWNGSEAVRFVDPGAADLRCEAVGVAVISTQPATYAVDYFAAVPNAL